MNEASLKCTQLCANFGLNAHTLVEKVDVEAIAEGLKTNTWSFTLSPPRASLVKTNHVVNLRDCKKNSEHKT